MHEPDDDYRSQRGTGTKPCRACTDFKTWMTTTHKLEKNKPNQPDAPLKHDPKSQCPLDKDELGRASWSLFHTMAAYYPEKPTNEEQLQMKNLINSLARFYPCETCAKDFKKDIKENPPRTENRLELSRWWCNMHNKVNKKLGKPLFDCSKLDQRWLDGWSDGSCD